MSSVLLAPTERDLVEKMEVDATVSSIPETKGADVLIGTPRGLFGIQRKQVPHDFLKSVLDGRLARETSLLKDLPYRLIVGEGKFRYYKDGTVVVPGVPGKSTYKFTRNQIWGVIFDIEFTRGIPVLFTEDLDDTVNFIRYVQTYMCKSKHTGLFRRPAAPNVWGTPTSEESAVWLMQGFDGVGPGLAEKILTSFGGRVPFCWDCDFEDLLNIPGIGPHRAKKLWEALPKRRNI